MTAELTAALATLPRFAAFDPTRARDEVKAILSDNLSRIDALLDQADAPTWPTLVEPLDALNDRLQRAWSPLRHLHGVADTEALRVAYHELLPEVAKYHAALSHNDRLFRAYEALRASSAYPTFKQARRQVVDHALRDFKLGGIALDEASRQRYTEIQQALTARGARFEEHLLDATRAWEWHTTDPERLRGLPESTVGLAREAATRAGKQGYVLTLDPPCYLAVMTHAADRALREAVYEAYVTRASDVGPHAGRHDNSTVITEILALRHELARLLGFGNYAEYSLATKMAHSPAEVLEFLHDLARRARPHAERERAELERFAREILGLAELAAWDVAFAAEKLRQHAYAISQEQLRPYFPAPRVVAGLFEVAGRLFGVQVARVAGVEVWQPDVEFYRIADADGRLRGLFYLDLYARPGKRGGAWMDECVNRRATDHDAQLPVAYLTCNFTPPLAGQPSLLTHEEVVTLFHEFGHGLHHMLTLVDEPPVSGINGVPWDAVELPSQFLENWCWEEESLALISGHVDTGATLPSELYERLRAARNFQAGMKIVRQLEFALFDFRLHVEYGPDLDVQGLLDDVRSEVAVLQPPAYNRFQHGFSHIFAGGYAAGYYSYKWAEVLAADAFGRFEEEGVFNPAAGEAFLHAVLEAGGAVDAGVAFRAFRGRDPEPDALLRRSGLVT